MNSNQALIRGASPLLATAMIWGGMFTVALAVLRVMDAFHLTLVRYAVTALVFAFALWWKEGRASLAFDGRGLTVAFLGTLGFAGFSLLVFGGLARSRPEHGAVIVATMPMLTALTTWVVRGVRPSRLTLASVGAAFAGVLLVISKGHADFLHEGSAVGDAMILAGALCWVGYTMGAASFPGWSALRYTALTTLTGTGAIALATLAAIELGVSHPTRLDAIAAVGWQLAYMIALASVFAVLAWNLGMRTLGAANGVLFINFVPVTAFAIRAVQGQPIGAAELFGAALVIGALLVSNLAPRLRLPTGVSAQDSAVRLNGAGGQ